ncbi:hypothetical protein E2P81_ATG01131 [Venturia nashicola]|uniref:Uncharacterized protein n=1 Tax=Venturia nashicola TaxID=86259 RepID=A0A4Z1PKX2_9PEZI|nr:hypothetical protein E6O75_ATG01159 [Venturia nashicola]TLD38588.1 hypothetical protein E2P81_ATG01131 [Venturia nashicola]
MAPPPPALPAPTTDMTPIDSHSDTGSRASTTAFYMLLSGLISLAILAIAWSFWLRRRNGRSNQKYGSHNIEAAYLHNPNYPPLTGSKTLNAIKTAGGRITNAIRVKKMGRSAPRTIPEEIELPRIARVYMGPGNSTTGAGAAPGSSRLGQEPDRKRADNIQQRRRDSEMERKRGRSRMEAGETAPPYNNFQDPLDSFEKYMTLKEALTRSGDDVEKEKKDFACTVA